MTLLTGSPVEEQFQIALNWRGLLGTCLGSVGPQKFDAQKRPGLPRLFCARGMRANHTYASNMRARSRAVVRGRLRFFLQINVVLSRRDFSVAAARGLRDRDVSTLRHP